MLLAVCDVTYTWVGLSADLVSRSCLLLSAFAWGSESRIYSHQVRMYVHGGSHSGMSHGTLHTIGTRYRYRPHVRHTVSHIQICSTQIDGRTTAFFGDMIEVGDNGAVGLLWLGYYWHKTAPNNKRSTCHARLTFTRMWHMHTVCTLARGKDVHAYS